MIEIYEGFFFFFLLWIGSPSSDSFGILYPFTYILERLRFSLINLFFLVLITFGYCYLIFLSSELADKVDLF